MKELTRKIDFIENMIIKFAQSKMNDANDVFKRRHGYDLRETQNNDHLRFCNWKIDNDYIVLIYVEVTPHDCPYGIELEYLLSDLSINCK